MNPRKVKDYIYEIEPEMKVVRNNNKIYNFQMNVPSVIYANDTLIEHIVEDGSVDQLTNVACLPGIKGKAIAMSDAHQGYGFPIGGVAATDINEGAISPGGVGYDINCGVRLLNTGLTYQEVNPRIPDLIAGLFENVPSGLGSKGKIRINPSDLNSIMELGIEWAINQGFGFDEDRNYVEDNGSMQGVDSNLISATAKQRGLKQIGSLGSGNHFIEIQKVEEIYDPIAAKVMGIELGQITVMIHTGSRGLGHQIATDAIDMLQQSMENNNVVAPDMQLSYCLGSSKEAEKYLGMMKAAANFAFVNRHIIMHWVRETFNQVLKIKSEDIKVIYDVAHNILKQEEHVVDGKRYKLNVHRKGATRALPPEHPEIPKKYYSIGQPILIPGSMGTSSYLCVGQPDSMKLSFASTAHGAGREMSREKAKRQFRDNQIKDQLAKRGIMVMAASREVVSEEAPLAYKNIDTVVDISHNLGILKKVARLVPIAVTKG